jgi:hypothetical protein
MIALANDAYTRPGQERQEEVALFLKAIISAVETEQRGDGNTVVFDYLTEAIMGEELAAAVEWWNAEPEETSPPTPFVPENPAYSSLPSQVLLAEGESYDAQAETLRLAAEAADADSDRFDLAKVFFAAVLFVAGRATIVQRRSIQVAYLGLSATGLVAGFVILATTSGAFALG